MNRKPCTVYIPDVLPPLAMHEDILGSLGRIETGMAANEDDLIERLRGADAVVLTSRIRLTQKVIEASAHIKIISKYGVGLENIDIRAATDSGIPVVRVPDGNTGSTAEHTIAIMLSAIRGIQEQKQVMQRGGWRENLSLGGELNDSIIGIIGYGNIARKVIAKLEGFGARQILVYSESRSRNVPESGNVQFADLPHLLKESDIVSIHKTLTPGSRKLIGKAELRSMKDTAYLVNTSRGELIDEPMLIRALQEKWIAGAALDVFEKEPISPDNPLLFMKNATITPHAGGSTIKARTKMISTAMKNVVDVLEGRRPDMENLVNPEVFESRRA